MIINREVARKVGPYVESPIIPLKSHQTALTTSILEGPYSSELTTIWLFPHNT